MLSRKCKFCSTEASGPAYRVLSCPGLCARKGEVCEELGEGILGSVGGKLVGV